MPETCAKCGAIMLPEDHARFIDIIVDCGKQLRCMELEYQLGSGTRTNSLLEPYVFQRSGNDLMIMCWVVEPEHREDDSWRNFRIDRIESLVASDREFIPRRIQNLDHENVREFDNQFEPMGSIAEMNDYFEFLSNDISQAKLSRNAMMQAKSRGGRLSISQRRAVHAEIFKDAIAKAVTDGEILFREMEQLRKLRRLLSRLGWSP